MKLNALILFSLFSTVGLSQTIPVENNSNTQNIDNLAQSSQISDIKKISKEEDSTLADVPVAANQQGVADAYIVAKYIEDLKESYLDSKSKRLDKEAEVNDKLGITNKKKKAGESFKNELADKPRTQNGPKIKVVGSWTNGAYVIENGFKKTLSLNDKVDGWVLVSTNPNSIIFKRGNQRSELFVK